MNTISAVSLFIKMCLFVFLNELNLISHSVAQRLFMKMIFNILNIVGKSCLQTIEVQEVFLLMLSSNESLH